MNIMAQDLISFHCQLCSVRLSESLQHEIISLIHKKSMCKLEPPRTSLLQCMYGVAEIESLFSRYEPPERISENRLTNMLPDAVAGQDQNDVCSLPSNFRLPPTPRKIEKLIEVDI